MGTKKVKEKLSNRAEIDLRLARYRWLDENIKDMTKELSQIKDELKHSGTVSGEHYVATVTLQDVTRAPGSKKLIELFGESVTQYFSKSQRTIIKVSKVGES